MTDDTVTVWTDYPFVDDDTAQKVAVSAKGKPVRVFGRECGFVTSAVARRNVVSFEIIVTADTHDPMFSIDLLGGTRV